MDDRFRHASHRVHRAGDRCASAFDLAPLGERAFNARQRHLHRKHRSRVVPAPAFGAPPHATFACNVEPCARGHPIFWTESLEVMSERPAVASMSFLWARDDRKILNESINLNTHRDGLPPQGQPSTHHMHDFAASHHRARRLTWLATTSRGGRSMARPVAQDQCPEIKISQNSNSKMTR